MKITYSRVETLDVRNFLGFDAPEKTIREHQDWVKNSSVIWLGKLDGVDAAACGTMTTSLFSKTAYVWVLTTPLCKKYPVYFLLWTQLVLREIFELYDDIVGYCSCDNEPAQKWMRWLGATFDEKITYPGHFTFRISRP